MDYTERLRISSRFFGWARVNHQQYAGFGDRCTAGNELFSDRSGDVFNPDLKCRMQNHAKLRQQNVNRIEISGIIVLSGIKPFYPPGTAIRLVGDNLIPCYGVARSMELNFAAGELGKDQETIIYLASSEAATIYDGPAGPRVSSSYAPSGAATTADVPTATSTTTTTPKTPYEPSETPTKSSDYPADKPATKPTPKDDYNYGSPSTSPTPSAPSSGSPGYKKDAAGYDIPGSNKPTITPPKKPELPGDEGDSGKSGAAGKSSRQYTGAPTPANDYSPDPNRIQEDGTSRASRQEAIRERSEHWPNSGSGPGSTPSVTQQPGQTAQEGKDALRKYKDVPRIKLGGKTGGAEDQVIKRDTSADETYKTITYNPRTGQ